MKLQKILYFAYGHYLVSHSTPIFSEKIAAWKYGPVVPDIYHKYKEHGDYPIPFPQDLEDQLSIPNENIQTLLGKVLQDYRTSSAFELVDLTHQIGSPWHNTYYQKGQNSIIPDEEIRQYFLQPTLPQPTEARKKRKLSENKQETAKAEATSMEFDEEDEISPGNQYKAEPSSGSFSNILGKLGVDSSNSSSSADEFTSPINRKAADEEILNRVDDGEMDSKLDSQQLNKRKNSYERVYGGFIAPSKRPLADCNPLVIEVVNSIEKLDFSSILKKCVKS